MQSGAQRVNAQPPPSLVDSLARQARELGFDLFGIAPAVTPEGAHRLLAWIEAGYAAGMTYFQDRLPAYGDPSRVLAGVRSVIVLSYPYGRRPAVQPTVAADRPSGQIASYAWGAADYHDLIHPKLKQLRETIRQACPEAQSRGVVDSAPLMEREFARLAGLGWAGKNSLLLNKHRGSYFFLACLLTTLELPPSQPHESSHCGTCTRCLEACPTEAFPAPGVVDARRCISYLTIEHRGPIPRELRAGIGNWLFGCDVCQQVCPWNEHVAKGWPPDLSVVRGDGTNPHTPAHAGIDPALRPLPEHDPVDLIGLLSLDEARFRRRFRGTPMWRPRRRGLLRNAAICLGNAGDPAAVPALRNLLDDDEPLIRGAVAWALGELGGDLTTLADRLEVETDPQVRDELLTALRR